MSPGTRQAEPILRLKPSSGQSSSVGKRYDILVIAPTSFFADYGCHVRILEEALVLRKMGHQIRICTYYKGRDVEGLTIERTMPIPWREEYEVGSSRHKIGFDVLLSIKSLAVVLRRKPDIIHAHLHEGALIGYPLSRLCGVPLVFDFQGSVTGEMVDHQFLNPKGPFYRPMYWLEGIIDHLPGAIITSSQHAADLLQGEFNCRRDNIHIVPDSVNADFFTPSSDGEERLTFKTKLGIPAERKVVAYLGLLAEYQGIPHLLRAARQVVDRRPDTHFLIMGYPNVPRYREMADQLGLADHTTFTGKIPYEEAPRYLALGDIAVGPKLSATEGSGKLLNYMAMGLATVTFDTQVSREYLGDWGIYAERGNVTAFAQCIESLLTDEIKARRLGQQLRARAVEKFSWDQAGEKILNIYETMLANK
ncbi:MAG: glycosyltransferase family 4 protein [Anaerolineae bacterium]